MPYDPYSRINPKAIIEFIAKQPLMNATTQELRDEFMAHNPGMCKAIPRLKSELAKLDRRGFIEYDTVDHVWEIDLPEPNTFKLMAMSRYEKPIRLKTIQALSAWELLEAEEYVGRAMLRASDNIIRVPAEPEWLKAYR